MGQFTARTSVRLCEWFGSGIRNDTASNERGPLAHVLYSGSIVKFRVHGVMIHPGLHDTDLGKEQIVVDCKIHSLPSTL
jgi:hypothetical protein